MEPVVGLALFFALWLLACYMTYQWGYAQGHIDEISEQISQAQEYVTEIVDKWEKEGGREELVAVVRERLKSL